MGLGRYIFVRSCGLLVTLFILSIIVFTLMHAIPGGPFDLEGGDKGIPVPKVVRQEILKKYNLDGPLYSQYYHYMNRAVRLDFGRSFSRPSETVMGLIARTWWVSFQLGLATFLVALVVGMGLGIAAALHRNRWIDYVSTTFAVGGTVFPNFVVAVILLVIFGVYLQWLPTNGWGGFKFWIMPLVAYSLLPMSQVARFTRTSMIEVLDDDFVRTARSKGLSERLVVTRHVLRNALIPILTLLGQVFADVTTGSFFIETIFRIPGLGRYFTTSIMQRDYPMIMATTLLLGALFGIINLITDVLYAFADPRIRLGEKETA